MHRVRSLRGYAWMLPLVCLLTLGSPATAKAQQAETRDQAVEIALSRHGGGKVLGVRKKTRGDGSTYFEVKILTDGEVSIYQIEAN